jgi:hypothetical protein
MKGHGCYLANGAWLEGRDNQDNLATWHEMFLEKSIPSMNFATKSSFDDRTLICECDSMLHDDWLDIPCVIILRSFLLQT